MAGILFFGGTVENFWELLLKAERSGEKTLLVSPEVLLPCGCRSPILGKKVYKGALGWMCTTCGIILELQKSAFCAIL